MYHINFFHYYSSFKSINGPFQRKALSCYAVHRFLTYGASFALAQVVTLIFYLKKEKSVYLSKLLSNLIGSMLKIHLNKGLLLCVIGVLSGSLSLTQGVYSIVGMLVVCLLTACMVRICVGRDDWRCHL